MNRRDRFADPWPGDWFKGLRRRRMLVIHFIDHGTVYYATFASIVRNREKWTGSYRMPIATFIRQAKIQARPMTRREAALARRGADAQG